MATCKLLDAAVTPYKLLDAMAAGILKRPRSASRVFKKEAGVEARVFKELMPCCTHMNPVCTDTISVMSLRSCCTYMNPVCTVRTEI